MAAPTRLSNNRNRVMIPPPNPVHYLGLNVLDFNLPFAENSDDSGMWPLLGARVASISLLALALVVTRRAPRLPAEVRPMTLVAGVFDTSANALYLAAASRGLLSLVSVIAALYPASTVVLARVVLGERVQRWQFGGFVLAALAVGLVAATS